MAKDYYQILGVPRNASDDEIKKAYRAMAMRFHPDKNPGNEQWANEKFKEINEAFCVLGDPDKRRQHDQFGTEGNVCDIFGNASTRTTFEDVMKDFGGSGLRFDFLDDIFGDIVRGKGVSFKVFRGGSGAINLDELLRQQPPQAAPETVTYEITIAPKQAVPGMEKDLVRRGKKLRVKIPAGVKSGAKIRLRNARQITDGQPGDIVILVKVKE